MVLSELPTEILVKIASYMSVRSICRASRVCWRFKQVFYSDDVWKPKCENKLTVPNYVLNSTKTYRTKYIRILYWFYCTQVPRAFQRNIVYPARITSQRPTKLKALEESGFLPESWCNRERQL
jgi:F-box associated protein